VSTEPTIPAAIELHAPDAMLPPPAPKPTTLDPGQEETSFTAWELADAEAGVWECGPGRFTAAKDGHTEVCQILSGGGNVEGEDGVRVAFGPGSLLVLPAGWRGTWTLDETTRKSYVVIPA
jgi:uncharacterized protein